MANLPPSDTSETNLEQVRFNPKISAAIRDRNISALRDLFAEDPGQVSAFTPFAGGAWLHYASREGDAEAVRLLLSLGADVNKGDSREGRGALCDACLGGHADIVAILLSAGARIDTSTSVRNPLFSSIVANSLPSAVTLLDHGMDTKVSYDGPFMKNMDAVSFAMERGSTQIAEEIARRQAEGDPELAQRILDKARATAQINNA